MRVAHLPLIGVLVLASCSASRTSSTTLPTTAPPPSTTFTVTTLPSSTTSAPPLTTTSSPNSTSTTTSTTSSTSTTSPVKLVSYIVQAGDTLWSLAIRFDTTVEAIVSQNGLSDPSTIEVGQLLLIPAGEDPFLATSMVLRTADSGLPQVALTFDAGSDAGHTEEILAILADYGLRASFGLTGRWVEAYPELAARVVDLGHQVLNHSYSHMSVTGFSTDSAPLTEAERRAQVEWGEAAIFAAAGVSPRPLFRPPYGDYDQALLEQLPRWGYSHLVMWTVDSLGWNGLPAGDIVDRCLQPAGPGVIYLFHVGAASADFAALPAIIEGLLEQGLQPVTVSDLLGG